MMVRWSGEGQVNLNLSLTLVDVKLVKSVLLFCVFMFPNVFICLFYNWIMNLFQQSLQKGSYL